MAWSRWTAALVGACLVASGSAWAQAPVEKPVAKSAERSPRKSAESADDSHGIPEVAEINRAIRQAWLDNEVKPSPPASDGEWCRRVFLDVLGRTPSVDELQAFLTSKDLRKRALLVAELLEGERYSEEYARNWTTIWTNTLIGRSGGTEDGSLTNREGMQKYLRDCFARNTSYDRMVRDLVTARGATKPGAPEFNGATNFLADKVNDEKASLATAATSRIFLGLQVQCTQCHNHPFNEWKQRKYWEMNAFFRQTRALRTFANGTRDVNYARLVDEDFAGEGADPENAEIYYELRDGTLSVAYPVFVDGTELSSKSGYLSDISRRAELGDLVVQSPYMPRALVNRYWAHFLGYGFSRPIDDMGPHNAPSHPQLLDYLTERFVLKSHDLKQLISWIALSQAYGLSSRAGAENRSDDPELGETPLFSRFYLRHMRAEELYESLLVATEAHRSRGAYEEQEAVKRRWLDQFVTAFGNDEGEESTTFNGTIPQALMMFNGELIKDAIKLDEDGFLSRVANGNLNNRRKIDYLFLAALARVPTRREAEAANYLLVSRNGDVAGVLQDIWWAVLNSNEFIINH